MPKLREFVHYTKPKHYLESLGLSEQISSTLRGFQFNCVAEHEYFCVETSSFCSMHKLENVPHLQSQNKA